MTKTDYFCVLDPDDFWIDEYKIQKALDFLEKNKEYTIYVTDTMLQHPDGRREKYIKRKRVTDSDFQGFLNKKAALGCTLGSVYRNVIFKNGLPEKMTVPISETSYKTFRGDAFRNAVHLHEGKAHCVPFEDAVYRVTEEGLWMGSSKFSQGILTASLNRDLWLYYDKKYPQFLLKSYLAFNSVKDLLADELLKADNNALPPEVKTAVSLYRLYKENMPIIEEMFQKQIPLRYKIRRHICRAIGAKLKKKGLV